MIKVLLFFEIAFGFFVFVRAADELRIKNLISARAVPKMVVVILVWMIFWAFLPKISFAAYSVLFWIPLGILHFCPLYLRARRRKQFRQELSSLLNAIIIKMRVGQSFRSALQASSQSLTDFSRVKVEQVLEGLTLDGHTAAILGDDTAEMLLHWFRAAEKDAHRTLPRICQLRDKLRTEEALTKKIRQALQQLYAQIWVLGLLYSGLLAFILRRFGWRQNEHLIAASVVLFLFGGYLSLRQGRGFKWTV